MSISKEQFVSIGQSIYSTWLGDACELDRMTKEDRRSCSVLLPRWPLRPLRSLLRSLMAKRGDKVSKPKWQNREYREAYLEASLEQGIAWQIRINRQKRGITQEDLAKSLGITLPMLQELEDPEIGGYSLETLVKVAKVFDCALSVKFIPYSELARDSQNLSEESQYAPPYTAASSVKREPERIRHAIRGLIVQFFTKIPIYKALRIYLILATLTVVFTVLGVYPLALFFALIATAIFANHHHFPEK